MIRPKIFLIIKEHSERVASKNFKEISKVPLHEYYIRQRSPFDIFIDTDSDIILEEYSNRKKWPNVVVYERDIKHIAMESEGDVSPAPKMIERFLNDHINDENESIITSHVTSPFLKNDSLFNALKLMNNFNSVSSVKSIQEFCVFKDGNSIKPINFNYSSVVKTQSLKPIYVLNGAFFIINKKIFLNNDNKRISNNHYYFTLSDIESIDIDNEYDLQLARLMADKMQ